MAKEKENYKNKFTENREDFVKQVIESLDKGEIPWEKDWTTNSKPLNPITKTEYKGINNIMLSTISNIKGYDDPRWMTYKQAKGNEWQVKKDEKGAKIELFKFYDKSTKKDLDMKKYNSLSFSKQSKYFKENVQIIAKNYVVFNGEQIEGIPGLEKKERKEVDYNKIDSILENSNIKISYGGDRAYYDLKKDTIQLPNKADFRSANSFYGTALHELAHSTGHPQRLNRDLSGKFGSESYAKEELRAEFSSVFLGQEKGLNYSERNLENSAAYIKSWSKILKNDINELFVAAKTGNTITKHILGYENTKQPEFKKSKEKKVEFER